MPEFDDSVGRQTVDAFCQEDIVTERWLDDAAPYMRVEYEGEMTEGLEGERRKGAARARRPLPGVV